jgi:putative resolvase
MKEKRYVSPREAHQILGVSVQTLRNWEKEGRIETIKTPAGHRRYNLDSLVCVNNGTTIIYARVSSYKQRADLQRQADYLQSLYPTAEVVTEIGSGLNYKRPKFKAVLERVMSGDVAQLVVGHKDRLARFGFDFFQWLCEQNNCKLVVQNNCDLSPEREMVEDILAIVHVFSCRLYGLRKYKTQIKKDTDLP